MKYSSIVSSFAVLFASSIVMPIDNWLKNQVQDSLISLVLAIVIAAIISILIEATLNFLPKQLRCLRRIIYPMAQFEGVWIQIHDNTNEFAICDIEFDKKIDDYVFSGKHYTSSGFVVSFVSNTLHYDEKIKGFDYLVQGQHDDGEFVKCGGYITFNSFASIGKKTLSGRGSFVEIGSSLNLIKFNLVRPSKSLIKKLKNADSKDYNTIISKYCIEDNLINIGWIIKIMERNSSKDIVHIN